MNQNLPKQDLPEENVPSEPPVPPKTSKSKFQEFLDSKYTRITGTILLFIFAFLTALSFGYIVETIRLTQ